MRIERSHDMGRVHSIMLHPAIWPHIADDGVCADTFAPPDAPNLYWLLVLDGEELLGLFMVHPHNVACYEIHTCLLPLAWGKRAARAAQLVQAWLVRHTPMCKLITHVPVTNRLAYRFAKQAGLRDEGLNRASFLKHQQLLDQHLLGITREEILCQQERS